jgi:hypothetical protein
VTRGPVGVIAWAAANWLANAAPATRKVRRRDLGFMMVPFKEVIEVNPETHRLDVVIKAAL